MRSVSAAGCAVSARSRGATTSSGGAYSASKRRITEVFIGSIRSPHGAERNARHVGADASGLRVAPSGPRVSSALHAAAFALPVLVHDYGADDDHALDDVLVIGVDPQESEAGDHH